MTIALLIAGIAMLLLGGGALVRGASALAEIYGISPLIVGLTVVAFGTSAPELVVNSVGAVRGETALAFGNVAGSNIANLGLVLGVAALISPVALAGSVIRRELPLLLLATVMLVVMAFDSALRGTGNQLDRSDGLILLGLFSIFIYMMVIDLRRQREDALVTEVDSLSLSGRGGRNTQLFFIVAGAAGLALGAELTITHGSALAANLGVSPALIGLLVVAIGTSLPELICSVMAAMDQKADLCVGNVIGSNLFNTLFVLPISTLITPIDIPPGGLADLAMALALAALLLPVFLFGRAYMGRTTGALFVLMYVGYMSARLILG
ncbi:MAG: calcium/sodium antiporter [Halioglobus sp.]